jgi:predicted DNA-binding protein
MVGITQGQPVSTSIRLTEEEVKLIKRISKELSENTRDYHVKLWIEE